MRLNYKNILWAVVGIGFLIVLGISSSSSQTDVKGLQTSITPTSIATKTPSQKPTNIPSPTILPTNTPTSIPTATPTIIYPTNTPTPQPASQTSSSGLSNDDYYTNSAGNEVHSPAYSDSVPAGASAICGDGTYSFSQSRRGTCSHHGGVAQWL